MADTTLGLPELPLPYHFTQVYAEGVLVAHHPLFTLDQLRAAIDGVVRERDMFAQAHQDARAVWHGWQARAERAEGENARLREALAKAHEHVASVGWPVGDDGKYDRNGTWIFMDALPREVDAAEIASAHNILAAALAPQTEGEK